jgi:hypothetical protein
MLDVFLYNSEGLMDGVGGGEVFLEISFLNVEKKYLYIIQITNIVTKINKIINIDQFP